VHKKGWEGYQRLEKGIKITKRGRKDIGAFQRKKATLIHPESGSGRKGAGNVGQV